MKVDFYAKSKSAAGKCLVCDILRRRSCLGHFGKWDKGYDKLWWCIPEKDWFRRSRNREAVHLLKEAAQCVG